MKGIIVLGAAVVAVWGVIPLTSGVVYVTAPTNALSRMLGSPGVEAAWYLGAAFTAGLSLWVWPRRPYRWLPLMLSLPLLFTAMMAMTSSFGCVVAQHYADLEARPWRFILKDQALSILFGLAILIAVLGVHCKPALSTFSSRSRV